MNLRTEFFIILIFLLVFNIAVVSASDSNSTGDILLNESPGSDVVDDVNYPDDSTNDGSVNDLTDNANQSNSTINETRVVKTNPKISISSKNVKSRDCISIFLKNSTGSPLKYKKLHIVLNNKKSSINTNSKGIANLNVNLDAKSYKLTISYDGDNQSKALSKEFHIKVSKLSTKINTYTNFVIRGNHLYFYLVDQRGDAISGKQIIVKFKGKTYTKKTNKNGRISFKIKKYPSKYSISTKFKGDNQFKSSSKTLKFYVVSKFSLKISNSKLLTKGYLRIYLKDSIKSKFSKKTIIITIGNKKFSKKTSTEGIIVLKPNVPAKIYTIKAKHGKYWVAKKIKCIDGKVKDPLKENISLKNGIPDLDMMPGNYVMGDGKATYTLTKSQYKEVIKRDSYCLFLNNKLSKYTFFKTKSHPNTNHIIVREKWNVIERAINLKLVHSSKAKYWPGEITVSLKGKSYTYPEVRDVQNTNYNCGPTSASVCSQVLRNYISEKQLAKQMGTNRKDGTKCPWIINGLEKNHFNCTYFYKASFGDALNELKKGGAALIFHANRHYVSILDISKNGKKVLVSNSYGAYDGIPTKWVKVSVMKNKFSHWEESLIVKLNYNLSKSTKESTNCFYNSMGTNWARHNVHEGLIK